MALMASNGHLLPIARPRSRTFPANARIVVRAREIFINGKEGYPAVKKVIRRALAVGKSEDQPIAAGTVQPFHAKLGVA